MNIRADNAQRAEVENLNDVVPHHACQNPQVLIVEGSMSNVEIRSAIYSLTQVFSTQVAKDARVQVNRNANTTISRIRDFTRMNPPTFYGFKVEKDPQGFIDEVFYVHDSMGVSTNSKMFLEYGMSYRRMRGRL